MTPAIRLAACALAAVISTTPTASADDMTFVTPDTIKWTAAPPVFPKGAQFVVLSGNPREEGPYVVRLKLPNGYTIPPHWHTQPENVTVLSGAFHIGMGDKLDKSHAHKVTATGHFAMPGKMHHYAWAEGETVIDVFSFGPFDLAYVDPKDDPRPKQ
jgi:hypothetical protein